MTGHGSQGLWALARAGAFLLAVCLAPCPAIAQEPAIPDEIRNDSDPTKPILYSLRNEYYSLLNGAWNDVVKIGRASCRERVYVLV